jgi:flagellar motor switch protein FliG
VAEDESLDVALARPRGAEIAAILLMLLSEEEAANVLARLDPEEVQSLGGAMFEVANVSERQVDDVLDLFVSRARARTTIGFEADAQIRGMMERALGDDNARKILDRITPPARQTAFDALKWFDAPALAGALEGEHPQVLAVALAHLDAELAGQILEQLPEIIQADIVYRIATLSPVTTEALQEVESLILAQVAGARASTVSKRGGPGEAAQIVNGTSKSDGERIVRSLTKFDKLLAQAVRDEMFVFDDLMTLDEKSLSTLFRAVESEALVVALKGADAKLRKRIFGCMSARAVSSIEDEMAERGPMPLSDVQQAQKGIVATARQMAEAGTIRMSAKSDDYV